MKITQLRNATIILQLGAMHILVDPMLAAKETLQPLRLSDGLRRNPIVDLPTIADEALASVTHCLITHCQKGHFDHLDSNGKRWLRERQIPVICTPHDAPYLRERGLNVISLTEQHASGQTFFGGTIKTVRCTHGRGLVGSLMEHGVGYFLEMPNEPSVYLAGDTILSAGVKQFLLEHQPEINIIPSGGARMDVGGEIIMGQEEVISFTQLAHGKVVANHLEALSHCPVTRTGLAQAAREARLADRLCIPADGETLSFHTNGKIDRNSSKAKAESVLT